MFTSICSLSQWYWRQLDITSSSSSSSSSSLSAAAAQQLFQSTSITLPVQSLRLPQNLVYTRCCCISGVYLRPAKLQAAAAAVCDARHVFTDSTHLFIAASDYQTAPGHSHSFVQCLLGTWCFKCFNVLILYNFFHCSACALGMRSLNYLLTYILT